MTTCHGCGGTIGVDCFNPQECEEITRQQAAAYRNQYATCERPPWDIAEEWYTEDQISNAIQRAGSNDFGSWERIPEDVHSSEFARWITHQYRLAMAKGIQLGRGQSP